MEILKSVLLVISAACMVGCHNESAHTEAEEKAEDGHHHDENAIFIEEANVEKLGIKTIEVRAGKFREAIEVSGKIMPARGSQKTVVARSSGIVSLRNGITEGSAVGAGSVICHVSAKGMVGGDPNNSARIAYEAAKKEFQRVEPLYKEKLVSAREYNDAKSAYELAANNYVKGSEVSTVSSPLSGIVNKIYVEDGGYVDAGAAIASVSENRRLTLRADLPQKYLSSLPDITTANFKLPYSDAVFSLDGMNGRKVSSDNSTVSDGGYVGILFDFDNRGEIVAGSYADVYLLCREKDNVISVPMSALTEEMGYYYVYVEIGHGEFDKRRVEIGGSNGSSVEIKSGLKEKELVVSEGAVLVKIAANSSVVPEGHHHH